MNQNNGMKANHNSLKVITSINNLELNKIAQDLINSTNDINVIEYIIENVSQEHLLDDNVLLKALENGFHFKSGNQRHKEIIQDCLNHSNLYEILDIINDSNDIVFMIINAGEKISLLEYLVKINEDKIKEILNNPYINQEHANFVIDNSALDTINNEEILELAINKGYCFNEYTLKLLEKYKNLLIKKIESIGSNNLEELLYLINNLSEEMLRDEMIINLAITQGYYFTKDTPQILKNNKEILKKILASIHFKDNNSFYIFETINNCNPDILDEQILNVAKNKLGYHVTINSPIEKINEIYEGHYEEYIKTLEPNYQENIKKLGQKLGCGLIYYERNNSLFNKEVIDAFGINAVAKIYKYYNLLGNRVDFDYLIKNNQLEKFKYLFTVLSDNSDNFKNFDMLLFLNFLKKYETYGKLCFDFIAASGISEESKKTLKTLLTNKYNLEIKAIDELKNIDLIIKEYNKKIIQSDAKLEIKNIICISLCNLTLDELNKMFYSVDANSLIKLSKEISDIKIKYVLEKYAILMRFLNYIRQCNDLDKLKIIGEKISSFDSKELSKIRENFLQIFENIKYFYGVELNSKLTKLDLLKNSARIVVSNELYQASNGKCVKYIDSYDNCIFFQHVMNAYGRGGKLYDFKKTRLVGKTRLSLSLISNNNGGIEREPIDMDCVTLLFDKIDPSSLIAMDSKDISSDTGINSLIVMHNMHVQFCATYDMLSKTKNTNYNEYNVYIENNDGSFIYPSGVKVTGDVPCQVEIDAAEYLGVPLVKIHKTKELSMKSESDKASNYSQSQVFELNKLNEIFNDLKEESDKQIKL